MIWFTWRQQRGTILTLSAAVLALIIFFVVTRHAMDDTIQRLSIAGCFERPTGPGCDALNAFLQQFNWLPNIAIWLNIVPPALGVFVGAPLVAREFEQSTQRFIWVQHITRTRWLAIKVMIAFGSCLLLYGLLTVLVSWWHGPFDQLAGSLAPGTFDLEGMVPLAYTCYALALGTAAGVLIGRTLPAMLTTVAGFLALRLPLEFLARPHYLPAITTTWDPGVAGSASPVGQHDWILQQGQWVDAAGRHVDLSTVFRTCDPNAPVHGFRPGDAFSACTHAHRWVTSIVYQPAGRFWAFQGIETAVVCCVALGLLALTFWLTQRISG
jgi:hypothetical protein